MAFLEKINPSVAVISLGLNNEYGFPHSIVMDRLDSLGVQVYRTDVYRDVIIYSDGNIIGKLGVVDNIIKMNDRYHCRNGTVEDVAMNRSIFQALNAEKVRLNRYDIAITPGKPAGRKISCGPQVRR